MRLVRSRWSLLALCATTTATDLPPSVAGAAPSPGPRNEALMVYDPVHKEMILYGGSVNDSLTSDLWAWNGTSWRALRPVDGVMPPPRGAAHLVYDISRQRIVMFGGRRGSPTGGLEILGDIWEWDGKRWDKITSNTLPLLHATVAYDPTHRRVVIFSGYNAGISRKTLTWDGRAVRVLDSAGPPGYTAMGVVSTVLPTGELTVVVAQSGRSADSVAMRAWRWSGTAWIRGELGPAMTNLQPAASAPDGTIYIYQKSGEWLTRPLMHTRSPAGVWTSVAPPVAPEQRGVPAIAYDPDRRRLVLYRNDLWEWDGARWDKRP